MRKDIALMQEMIFQDKMNMFRMLSWLKSPASGA